MTEAAETQAYAQMQASNVIVDYMHGAGSSVARDTLEHATAIAEELSKAGLLIARTHEVAISPERLNELKHAEVMLAALAVAGVDNWEGYAEAVRDVYGEDEGM